MRLARSAGIRKVSSQFEEANFLNSFDDILFCIEMHTKHLNDFSEDEIRQLLHKVADMEVIFECLDKPRETSCEFTKNLYIRMYKVR